jgi:YebC/PmpR family DNA-binding regulatory protein
MAGQDDAPKMGKVDALHRHRLTRASGARWVATRCRASVGGPGIIVGILRRAMSGHSKWSTIKRQKGATDAKRGALFTKVAREISVAARQGGGDPDANYRLRLAIEKARSVNMPSDNIKRTIDKATGGGEAEQYEEIVYEGYGPGGVAVLVEAQTDNRNRTAAEVRSMFTKSGGQLAGSGAVAWQFEPRGLITVPRSGALDADEVALAAIDAGAEDVDTDGDEAIEVYTSPGDLETIRKALESAGVPVESAESAMIAKQTVELDASKARQALRLVELLEDLDDVSRVTANFDIPEEVFAEVAG